MTVITDLDDMFFTAISSRADDLSRADIDLLAAGAVTAVHARDFLDAGIRRALMARIDAGELAMENYDDRRVHPPIARFGPVVNDYRAAGGIAPAYWDAAADARRGWAAATTAGTDPMRAAVARLRLAWPGVVRPATVGGRTLFAGAVREINDGALVHFDDVSRELGPDFFDDGPPIVQLAFNAWFEAPPEGGETTIWRRRWRPGDDAWRQRYGYAPALVEGCPALRIEIEAGDALIFDPRNLHAVAPAVGGRRVAIAFFMALTGRGELLLWS
ncbi:proline hydroxylase [Spirillospora sp. NPDC047279]|uniref:2OG-Fe(II) oxygenase n=1 Tax=Spirillospora sp. NPDC047279 TaxID=3155478 RepID=UPI0033CA4D30